MSWCPGIGDSETGGEEGWTMASAAEDNVLQVWRASRTLWGEEKSVGDEELEDGY